MLRHRAPPIDLDKTLGAVFIGNIVSASLFGLTSLQAFIFFSGNIRDRKLFKRLIAFLWFLDIVHLVLMTHGVYHYLVRNFDDFLALQDPTWSLLAQVIITCISDFIVRCVFARRIWLCRSCVLILCFDRLHLVITFADLANTVSGHNNTLLVSIVASSVFVFGMGIAFAARGFIDGTYAKLISESWILYTALGSSIVVDGLITVSLCMLLEGIRTGYRSMDSLVNTLMLYSINTGLLTSLCATACFVTFAIWPHQFVFMGFYFVLSKLYINSLLAVLNTREALRKRNTGMHSIPQSPSSMQFTTFLAATSPNLISLQTEEKSPSSITKPQLASLNPRYST
ncbi:hypothetical protein HYPSUDRAFT_434943 [Hypholoma sublateritium FD-334 SS-4]|uniref:DUF6534 domain-containing protein n=1 Tax=Hypholoma sublateritium (strain FD-334 SS-4) TaxID=945553 RepID=A0A0D2MM75_HYPSF|nr:hypothetical protein HYPSUDRAFT_434943 [Hypholoma sublateritium FD-334 SS-4]